MAAKKPKTLTELTASFDALPDSANVQARTVEAMLCISPATVWRMVKAGKLTPKKTTGGRATRFQVGEIRALLAA